MSIIENGVGDGTKAKVDDEKRLWTYSTAKDEATFISVNKGQYYLVCNGSGHHAYSGGGWGLHLVNRSSDQDCLIELVEISADGTGHYHLGKNGVVSVGTEIAPVNLNLRYQNPAPVEAYYSSTNLTFTTLPTRFKGRHMLANTSLPDIFHGALVLGSDNSLSVYWDWAAGQSGTVAMSIQFYMRDR